MRLEKKAETEWLIVIEKIGERIELGFSRESRV